MTPPSAFLNGQLVPQAEAQLPFHDAGLVFGATATEFVRTFQHQLFRLPEHLARLSSTCAGAKIPLRLEEPDLTDVATNLVERNRASLPPADELALIIIATPGPLGAHVGQTGDGPPTLAMHTFPLVFGRYAPWFRAGARLVTPVTRQVPEACLDPAMKHRSRLHWWLAQHEANEIEPGASALLLDLEDNVTETAAANFLLVRGGCVWSPPRDGILGGVSLRVTQELCRTLDIPFKERPIKLKDCLRADEAMLTGTAFCLAGVASVNRHALPWPGPITEKLTQAWSQQVGLDYRRQILAPR